MRGVVLTVAALLVAACSTTGDPIPTMSAGAASASPEVIATARRTREPSPTERPTPTPVLVGGCPERETLTLVQFAKADPACFPGEVQLLGWIDVWDDPIGWEAPPVAPAWLYYPNSPLAVLWSVRPVPDELGVECPRNAECARIFVYLEPRPGADLGTTPRWIFVVGHMHDPASATCAYDRSAYPSDGPWGPPGPDEPLVAECDSHLVITSFEDAPAP